MWKRSAGKYKSYGTLSKTTRFLSVFCEADVVQQCTEAQAGVVQDGSTKTINRPKNLCDSIFYFILFDMARNDSSLWAPCKLTDYFID